MGEELKDYKLYFKMEKDEFVESLNKFSNTLKETSEIFETIDNAEYSFDFNMTKEQNKQWKKLVGLSPLSKKRTRKLLMAHGFDRDTAQMYADTIKLRNMNKIKELIKIKEEYIDE